MNEKGETEEHCDALLSITQRFCNVYQVVAGVLLSTVVDDPCPIISYRYLVWIEFVLITLSCFKKLYRQGNWCGVEACLGQTLHHTPSRMAQNSDDETSSPPIARSRQMSGAACDECRRRKLRCDRQRPQCSVCCESGVRCETDRSTGHRGPKKGYLKALKNRVGKEPPILAT